MEAGARIKELRGNAGWSQETLAEKAFVSRQTVSNWETGKTYPDIESLVILSDLFGASIDSIVKGDLVVMSARISQEQIRRFNEDSVVYTVLLLISCMAGSVSAILSNWLALALSLALFSLAVFFAFRVERQKKDYDLQTFREIVAFSQGADVDEIRAQRKPRSSFRSIAPRVLAGAAGGITIALLCSLAVWALEQI